jgi:hypothetical protein
MAHLSQPAHSQYTRLGLTNQDATMTTMAQGITVTTIHSMCRQERTNASEYAATEVVSGAPAPGLLALGWLA